MVDSVANKKTLNKYYRYKFYLYEILQKVIMD